METVLQSIVKPDEGAIKAHLELLFAPFREEYPGGLIELRTGDTFASAYFNLRTDGVDDAVAFAASRSRAGANVYVGANPRKPGTHSKGAATDADVEITIWQFADIDEAETLEGLGKKLRPLPPMFSVDTGTRPHRRPHLYWMLEEPIYRLDQWTQRQRGIAAAIGSDPVVINPSRIMRLAGTVNFPNQKKLQKGYAVEQVTIKTEFDEEREAVTPDEIAHAFPLPASLTPLLERPSNNETGIPVSGNQSTLAAMRPTQAEDLINACLQDDNWHHSMIRLVAHLANKGRSSAEILAMAAHLTLPGYSVAQTHREMATALQGARTKFDCPEPEGDSVEAEEAEREAAEREAADGIFELLDIGELESMPPPSWLIHETISDEGVSILYGDPGAGKSFIALDMALRVAHGMDWHGREAKEAGVLYIAGEGARGLGKRVKGWCKQHETGGEIAPFLLLPVAVQLLEASERSKLLRTIDSAVERAGFPIGLIIIDTVSRALAGADENGQEAMGAFVAACDSVRAHAGGAVIGVHHSGKDKDRGMRGSTVLLGACDASLKVTKSENIVTLVTEKQKDAEEAEPVYMRMEKVCWAQGLEPEQSTLVPVLSSGLTKAEKQTISNDQIRQAFGKLADAWGDGIPLSHKPQTRRDGRYAPVILQAKFGGAADDWADLIQSWLENECLVFDMVNTVTKKSGLRVQSTPGGLS